MDNGLHFFVEDREVEVGQVDSSCPHQQFD